MEAFMNNKNEIIKKYSLFLKAKKLIIFSGILSVLFLFSFFIAWIYNLKGLSIIMLILSIVLIAIFIIFWITVRPMKEHILNLIDEYKINGNKKIK
jgi:uncharacterized membrane protein